MPHDPVTIQPDNTKGTLVYIFAKIFWKRSSLGRDTVFGDKAATNAKGGRLQCLIVPGWRFFLSFWGYILAGG